MRTPLWLPAVSNNQHIKQISSRFGSLQSEPVALPEDVNYVFLCFTNRCGSNYVAELIASTGLYNLAGENLNWDTVAKHAELHGLSSFQEYFSFLTSRYQRSKVLFIKTAISQIALLGQAGILDTIIQRSRFLLVERSDKLGQAISYVLAFATGRFTSWMDGDKPEDVEFSGKKIDNILQSIAEDYRLFDLFFAKNGLTPIHVIYEQLLADTSGYMKFIGQQMGLPDIKIDPTKLSLQRQAGSTNSKWRDLYLGSGLS